MRKRIFSAFMAVLTLVMLLPVIAMPVLADAAQNFAKGWSGEPQNSHFADTTGIFDQADIDRLDKAVQEAAEKLKLNIIVFAAGPSSYMSDSETERFCDRSYDETFGADTDGVFYFMDFTGKAPAYDYISTSGRAVPVYQNNIQKIMNSLLSSLPPSSVSDYAPYKNDIMNTVEYFLTQLNVYADKGESYYHDKVNNVYYYFDGDKIVITEKAPLRARLMTLLYAVPVGIIAGILFYFLTKLRYRFKSSASASVYVSREETVFHNRTDRFLRTHTTKTRIESSSSSGGGHSGGGGHHGGGGGHR